MLGSEAPITFAIVQLGDLNRVASANAVNLADQVQPMFRFVLLDEKAPLDAARFRLADGAFDLDGALLGWHRAHPVAPLPALGLTGAAYGDAQGPADKRFFFNLVEVGGPKLRLSMISTNLWSSLGPKRSLEPYLLYALAGVAICHVLPELSVHDEMRDCVLGSVQEPPAIDACVSAGAFCADCERIINKALREHRINNAQIAAVRKLLHRAAGRRTAFLAVPYAKSFVPVQDALDKALTTLGWTVTRADRVAQPRRVTDAIIQGILSADLVVADISGSNANVFYELGFAHAAGADVLMLTQDKRIPFDVTVERSVRYSASKRGLTALKKAVGNMVSRHESRAGKP